MLYKSSPYNALLRDSSLDLAADDLGQSRAVLGWPEASLGLCGASLGWHACGLAPGLIHVHMKTVPLSRCTLRRTTEWNFLLLFLRTVNRLLVKHPGSYKRISSFDYS